MQAINKLDNDFTRKLAFSLNISYSVLILTLLIISIILLLINIKFLFIRLVPMLAAILDADEFIKSSMHYKYCRNNVYNISPIHRLRVGLLCISREIQNSKNSNIILDNYDYESPKLNKTELHKIQNYKCDKFYDAILNKYIYMYINTDINNIYDSYKFENVINYTDIFYKRFGKINNKINIAILDRLNYEFKFNRINTGISKRIYLFYNLCIKNKNVLYYISNKKHIDSEIEILYKFIKKNIL